jgi:hypothetical protein
VTRLKDIPTWVALESRPAPDSNVRHDDIVVFAQHSTAKLSTPDNEQFLRRVVWWDETHQRDQMGGRVSDNRKNKGKPSY